MVMSRATPRVGDGLGGESSLGVPSLVVPNLGERRRYPHKVEFEPVAIPGEAVGLRFSDGTIQFYDVDAVIPLHRYTYQLLSATLVASGVTKTNLSNLRVSNQELLQLRWALNETDFADSTTPYVILYQPVDSGVETLIGGAQFQWDLVAQHTWPALNLGEFFSWADRYPAMEVHNTASSSMASGKIDLFGFRFWFSSPTPIHTRAPGQRVPKEFANAVILSIGLATLSPAVIK